MPQSNSGEQQQQQQPPAPAGGSAGNETMSQALRMYNEFVGVHRDQFERVGLPESLWPRLFGRMNGVVEDERYLALSEVDGSDADVEYRALGKHVLIANTDVEPADDGDDDEDDAISSGVLKANGRVFVFNHVWTTAAERAFGDILKSKELRDAIKLITGLSDEDNDNDHAAQQQQQQVESAAGSKKEVEEDEEEEPRDEQETEFMVDTLIGQIDGLTRERAKELLVREKYDLMNALVAAKTTSSSSTGGIMAGLQQSIEQQLGIEGTQQHGDSSSTEGSKFNKGDGASYGNMVEWVTAKYSCHQHPPSADDSSDASSTLDVYIPLPEGVTAQQIHCVFRRTSLKITIKGEEYISGELEGVIDPDECTWIIENRVVLVISLVKVAYGRASTPWPGLLKGEERIPLSSGIESNAHEMDADQAALAYAEVWRYLSCYLSKPNDNPNTALQASWYLLGPDGSSIAHSSKPNVKTAVFYYSPPSTGQQAEKAGAVPITIAWPIADIPNGTAFTRNYVPAGIDSVSKHSAEAYLRAFFVPGKMTPELMAFVEAYEQFSKKTCGSFGKAVASSASTATGAVKRTELPKASIVQPSLDSLASSQKTGRALKVFVDPEVAASNDKLAKAFKALSTSPSPRPSADNVVSSTGSSLTGTDFPCIPSESVGEADFVLLSTDAALTTTAASVPDRIICKAGLSKLTYGALVSIVRDHCGGGSGVEWPSWLPISFMLPSEIEAFVGCNMSQSPDAPPAVWLVRCPSTQTICRTSSMQLVLRLIDMGATIVSEDKSNTLFESCESIVVTAAIVPSAGLVHIYADNVSARSVRAKDGMGLMVRGGAKPSRQFSHFLPSAGSNSLYTWTPGCDFINNCTQKAGYKDFYGDVVRCVADASRLIAREFASVSNPNEVIMVDIDVAVEEGRIFVVGISPCDSLKMHLEIDGWLAELVHLIHSGGKIPNGASVLSPWTTCNIA
ncbi:hypothetical protein GQ42DRAFT_88977 [Ramicandelaber brevisporus]|nr:hypothetical protein GQ42DRAFT_88977 [Ramicandelaber brevisporus]